MESAVANKVTSIPFSIRPSVIFEVTCSHGPYFRGGVRHATGDNTATFIYKFRNVKVLLLCFYLTTILLFLGYSNNDQQDLQCLRCPHTSLYRLRPNRFLYCHHLR